MKNLKLEMSKGYLPISINFQGTMYVWTRVGDEVNIPEALSDGLLKTPNPYGAIWIEVDP